MFAFLFLGIRGKAIHHSHCKLHLMVQWELCLLGESLCVCQFVLFSPVVYVCGFGL